MKVKYYMRGLGIGIILTTLILSIGNTNEKLTDKEIMARAKELGMVTQDEYNANLDQIMKDEKPTSAANLLSGAPSVTPVNPSAESTVQPTVQPTTAQTAGSTTEPTITPVTAPTSAPTAAPTAVPTVAPSQETTKEPTPTKKPAADNNQTSGKEISFTINSGMSSGKVAELLVVVGLIEDEDDFNNYIVKAGKASIIRAGSYSIPQGASYEEILKKIIINN